MTTYAEWIEVGRTAEPGLVGVERDGATATLTLTQSVPAQRAQSRPHGAAARAARRA